MESKFKDSEKSNQVKSKSSVNLMVGFCYGLILASPKFRVVVGLGVVLGAFAGD